MVDFGIDYPPRVEQQVILRFETYPKAAHDRINAALQIIEARLEAMVIAATPRRTGALAALIGGRVYDHEERQAAVVGVRTGDANLAKKAAALEYGSTGAAIQVKAHKMGLDHYWAHSVPPITVDVPDYDRTGGLVASRFLRDPLAALKDEAIDLLRKAVQAASDDASK